MANLIIHRTRELELPRVNVGLQNLVGWQLIRKGVVIRQSKPRPNLITNAGLNLLGGITSIYWATHFVAVGTGTEAPATSQTSLIAIASPYVSATGGFADFYAWSNNFLYRELTRNRIFTEGEANGNLTEVGFFSGSPGTMFARQLLLDDFGNPTTITKTNEDQLRIIYKTRLYPPIDAVFQTINVGGTSIEARTQVVNLGSATLNSWGGFNFGTYHNSMLANAIESNNPINNTSGGYGTGNPRSSLLLAPYTNGNFYRDVSFIWEPVAGNFPAGFGAHDLSPTTSTAAGKLFATQFTPRIPKTDIHRLTTTHRISWGRYVAP